MNNRLAGLPGLLKVPVVGIVRNMSMEDYLAMLPVYVDAGLTSIEVTMNTAGAEEMIRYANEHYGQKLLVGAGTVCTEGDLHKAIAAGSKFIVTPVTDEKIIGLCIEKKIPIMPGAYTPTEIYRAWSAGAAAVKLFPATSLGPQYIKDVKAPLNEIIIMPTGGIDEKNIASFLNAGAIAAGVGSKLFDPAMIKARNWKGLAEHFGLYVKAVAGYGSIL